MADEQKKSPNVAGQGQGQGKTSTQRAQEARLEGDKETAQKEARSQHAASDKTEHFGLKTEDDVELKNQDAVTRDELQREFLEDNDSRFIEGDPSKGVRGPDQLSPIQQFTAEDLEERYNPEGRTVESSKTSREAGRE